MTTPANPCVLKYEHGIRRSFGKNEIRTRDLSKVKHSLMSSGQEKLDSFTHYGGGGLPTRMEIFRAHFQELGRLNYII